MGLSKKKVKKYVKLQYLKCRWKKSSLIWIKRNWKDKNPPPKITMFSLFHKENGKFESFEP